MQNQKNVAMYPFDPNTFSREWFGVLIFPQQKRKAEHGQLPKFGKREFLPAQNVRIFVDKSMLIKETKALCERYGRDFGEIKSWYDGYRLDGLEIYNPKSVVEAVESGKCSDYWARTSSIEAVTNYMNYDHGALKATIARLLSGKERRSMRTPSGTTSRW
jgi:hypothetical protein